MSPETIDYCQLLADGATLLDVRSIMEYGGGCLSGAINSPLNQIQDTDELKIDDVIIIYCVTGARSNSAKTILEARGFTSVMDMGSFRNYNC